MKKLIILLVIVSLFVCCNKDISNKNVITQDIDNYWKAYDKISTTKDSALQLQYLKEEFIDKASVGQKAMFEARNYSPEEYLFNINKYPKYWKSIRENTLRAKNFGNQIESGVKKLKKLYPDLKPAKVYFTIGAFRSPGTTMDSLVLIGSEMLLTNKETITSEFPKKLNYFKNYCKLNPIKNVEFLNVHEFVHTQQKSNHEYILIFRSVYEGIAEFLAEIATEKKSASPAIAYGKKNEEKVRDRFLKQLYSRGAIDDWLYNDNTNEFGIRDLGYYIGYSIARGYYNKAKNKKLAVKQMIELDYSDAIVFNKFIDESGYFSKPIKELKTNYEKNIPKVIGIQPFKNGSQNVNSGLTKITVEFSHSMQNKTDFELGPLGINNLMRVKRLLGFSNDRKFLTFEVELEPNKRYQLLLNSLNFKNIEGIRIQPYLIDFKTAKK